MSDSSDVLNSSESEPAMSEEMSEEEEGFGYSETEDVIPGQLSLNSSSSTEEIFSSDTRGRTKIVKKKPRLESSKKAYSTKVSCVATKKTIFSATEEPFLGTCIMLSETAIDITCQFIINWHPVHTFSLPKF